LSFANLSYADLNKSNLSFANLSYADLSNADLLNADLNAVYHKTKITKKQKQQICDADLFEVVD